MYVFVNRFFSSNIKQEGSKKKKDREGKVKSTIVVQSSRYKDNSDESDSEEMETQGACVASDPKT